MGHIKIKPKAKIPLYRQIVESVVESISNGSLKIGDKLPSLNTIKDTFNVSRDTVLTAFKELKNKGLIDSIVGKGYYVVQNDVNIACKVFLLFDELNGFKEDLYNAFVKHMGNNAQIDVFFHHFDKNVFSQTIQTNLDNYSHYVIMPANLQDIEADIKLLDEDKVFILDQIRPSLKKYASVYQDFENDVYKALEHLKPDIEKYSHFKLIFNYRNQPLALKKGFEAFCEDHQLQYQVLADVNDNLIFSNDLFLVLDDNHLILLLKILKAKPYVLGKDCGLISYNDHMLKEVVADGITTISTDFKHMGKQLAEMIKQGKRQYIANRSRLKIRKSI